MVVRSALASNEGEYNSVLAECNSVLVLLNGDDQGPKSMTPSLCLNKSTNLLIVSTCCDSVQDAFSSRSAS